MTYQQNTQTDQTPQVTVQAAVASRSETQPLAWGVSFLMLVGLLVMLLGSGCATSGEAPKVVDKAPALEQLKVLFPDTIAKGHPVVLDAYSPMCLDCRKLVPKLDALTKKYPTLGVRRVDIQHPKGNDKAIIKAFGIVTVPHVTFITADGKVEATYIEDESEAKLAESAEKTLTPSADKTP
jgi:thiol-disulfide isomerase/thioredoxin